MIPLIEARQSELEALCRRFDVRRLEVFGSAATEGTFRPGDSDLDFLVEFESPERSGYADRYFGLLESLEAPFETRVDLVVASSIRNPYFQASVDRTRKLLYGGREDTEVASVPLGRGVPRPLRPGEV